MKRNGNAEPRRRENRGAEGGGRGAAGAEVERRRREDRGAEGVGCWDLGGVSPSLPTGGGYGEGAVPPPQKFF